jgi:hypothetical protein
MKVGGGACAASSMCRVNPVLLRALPCCALHGHLLVAEGSVTAAPVLLVLGACAAGGICHVVPVLLDALPCCA